MWFVLTGTECLTSASSCGGAPTDLPDGPETESRFTSRGRFENSSRRGRGRSSSGLLGSPYRIQSPPSDMVELVESLSSERHKLVAAAYGVPAPVHRSSFRGHASPDGAWKGGQLYADDDYEDLDGSPRYGETPRTGRRLASATRTISRDYAGSTTGTSSELEPGAGRYDTLRNLRIRHSDAAVVDFEPFSGPKFSGPKFSGPSENSFRTHQEAHSYAAVPSPDVLPPRYLGNYGNESSNARYGNNADDANGYDASYYGNRLMSHVAANERSVSTGLAFDSDANRYVTTSRAMTSSVGNGYGITRGYPTENYDNYHDYNDHYSTPPVRLDRRSQPPPHPSNDTSRYPEQGSRSVTGDVRASDYGQPANGHQQRYQHHRHPSVTPQRDYNDLDPLYGEVPTDNGLSRYGAYLARESSAGFTRGITSNGYRGGGGAGSGVVRDTLMTSSMSSTEQPRGYITPRTGFNHLDQDPIDRSRGLSSINDARRRPQSLRRYHSAKEGGQRSTLDTDYVSAGGGGTSSVNSSLDSGCVTARDVHAAAIGVDQSELATTTSSIEQSALTTTLSGTELVAPPTGITPLGQRNGSSRTRRRRMSGIRTVAQGTLRPSDQYLLALDLHRAGQLYRQTGGQQKRQLLVVSHVRRDALRGQGAG